MLRPGPIPYRFLQLSATKSALCSLPFVDSDILNSLLPPSDGTWHPSIDPSKLYGPGEHCCSLAFRSDDLGLRKGSVLCVNRCWSTCAAFTTQTPTQ